MCFMRGIDYKSIFYTISVEKKIDLYSYKNVSSLLTINFEHAGAWEAVT